MQSTGTTLGHPFVREAEPREDHTVLLVFEGGERRVFDMKPYLSTEVFGPLRTLEEFLKVRIANGSLEWPGERDLAYDMLYVVSVPEPAPSPALSRQGRRGGEAEPEGAA